MAPPPQPGKRSRFGVLEIIVVVAGFIAIIGYNRLSIARFQRSLPNANSQIVGEWKSSHGPEHLVFRADKSVSMIIPSPPADGSAADGAPATNGPAPVTGMYKLSEGGKIYVQLMNGKKYSTIISPANPNRFDLIDSDTDGVTTFERVPAPPAGEVKAAPEAAPVAAPETPAPPVAAPESAEAPAAAPDNPEAPPAPEAPAAPDAQP
jgi:hypothetical protein